MISAILHRAPERLRRADWRTLWPDAALVAAGMTAAGRPALAVDRGGDAVWQGMWFLRAAGDPSVPAAALGERLAGAVDERLLGEQLPAMRLGLTARRAADGGVEAASGAAGHALFGRYLPARPGRFRGQMRLEDLRPERGGARLALEAARGDEVLARVERRVRRAEGEARLSVAFDVADRLAPALELRAWSDGRLRWRCRSVTLDRAAG